MAEVLTFIRHTRTIAEQGICYGQTDLALAVTYPEEMSGVLTKLAQYHPQLMISSPLQRCTKLASFLESHYKVPFLLDERLKEVSFGEWELKHWNEINQLKLLAWTSSYEDTPPPGGESFNMLLDRFDPIWKEMWQNDADEIFVIAHDGILRSALVKALKLTSRQVFSFHLSFGSAIRIKKIESDFYSIQII